MRSANGVSDEFLDQLSTSQTDLKGLLKDETINARLRTWAESEIEQVEYFKSLECINNAPYIFFIDGAGIARLIRGCCNDWTCPRCGHIRALHEYGRMVNGAKELGSMGESLYFLTLTCRGREMSLDEAENGYLVWTNRLLTTLRTKQKRAGKAWFYAQVTERQQRGHPHSHLITTFTVTDGVPYEAGEFLPNKVTSKHPGIYSQWLVDACRDAGLGTMVDYSVVRSPVAVAVYVAKYMFKDAVATHWPKGWRRIRYSRSWPKLPEHKPEVAFPLVRLADWRRMGALNMTVRADCEQTKEAAYARLVTCVI